VNLGYVRKRQSKTDKRVSELSLTKKGEALYPEIVKLRQEVADGLLTDIPAEQHEALVGQIRQVALRAVANETPGKND